jgi:hypothetical protein
MSHSNMVVGRLIGEIEGQLAEAHTIAKSANTCAVNGRVDRALTISLGIEELIRAADNLLQAAVTLNRSNKERSEDTAG